MEKTNRQKKIKALYWIIAIVIGIAGLLYLLYKWQDIFFDKYYIGRSFLYGYKLPFALPDLLVIEALYLLLADLIARAIFGKKKVVPIISSVLLSLVYVFFIYHNYNTADFFLYGRECGGKAPVIYLYPEEEIEANVKVNLNGEFTCTYPEYKENGWQVTATPDGKLIGESGRIYDFLYWEGNFKIKPDLSKGFCVKGSDSAEFLENSLSALGLNESETNTFIMYWLPILEKNEYNVITFQTDSYYDAAKLEITPKPDTVIRVNMLFYGTDKYVDIAPQDLTTLNSTKRQGFTVVEWGGEELDSIN